jgi:hypothetical protein
METIDTNQSGVKAEMLAAIRRRKSEVAAKLGINAEDLRVSWSLWDRGWDTEYLMYCHPNWPADLTAGVSSQEVGTDANIEQLRKKIRRSEAIHQITENE